MDDKLLAEILTDYVGKGLLPVLKERGINPFTFYEYLSKSPDRYNAYSRAQEHRAEMFSEELIEIADNDYDYQRGRNRIEVRRWLASKLKPKKFGDRIAFEVEGQVNIVAALAEGRARVAKRVEVVESTPVLSAPEDVDIFS